MWDEVNSYLNALYISPPETTWQSHNIIIIIRLLVHLQNVQCVYFSKSGRTWNFWKSKKKTPCFPLSLFLTGSEPSGNIYLYREVPKHFAWKGNMCKGVLDWMITLVSLMYFTNPQIIERFDFRMVFFYVPDAKFFEELRIFWKYWQGNIQGHMPF